LRSARLELNGLPHSDEEDLGLFVDKTHIQLVGPFGEIQLQLEPAWH
jgi:hypothetical protein